MLRKNPRRKAKRLSVDPKICTHPNIETVNYITDATTKAGEGIPYIKYHTPNILIRYCPDCNTYFTYHLNAIWWSKTE